MAAMATSGASDLLRGWPCWSTTVRRTVRSPRSRIWLATACAAAACSGVYRPCRSTNPAWPTPVTPDRSGMGLPIIWLASDQAVPCAPRGPCQSCSLPGLAGRGRQAAPGPLSAGRGGKPPRNPPSAGPGGRPPGTSGWPKAPFLRHGALTFALAHDLQHGDSEVFGFDVGEREERLGPLHAVDLENLGEQEFAQVRVIPDAQPDQQVQAAGHDAHVLGLRHRPDGTDDLTQVHAGPGRHGEIDDDGEPER